MFEEKFHQSSQQHLIKFRVRIHRTTSENLPPRGLQLGNRKSLMSVLGWDVSFQIAGQPQWVATGQLWLSSIFVDHRGISTIDNGGFWTFIGGEG